jgi:hypothetical protein
MNEILSAIRDLGKFLTFRFTKEDYDRLCWQHFAVGFVLTWLVGIARNWDLPTAPWFAVLGLGSVVYIFILSFVLYLFAYPVSRNQRSYKTFLTMISMTAAPGLIYGIPVERMTSMESAMQLNGMFLGIVAIWRVALALHFLSKGCENSKGVAFSILAIPICIVIILLIITGRVDNAMEFMGGMRETTSQTLVDNIVLTLCVLTVPGILIGLLTYSITMAIRRDERAKEKESSLRKTE